MKANNNEKILIIGAGPVGAMASIYLAKRGFNVSIYEGRQDLRRVDISAGRSINLALANRGIRPLADLGLMDQVSEMMIPMRGRMVHDVDGQTSFQAYGQRDDEVIYSISRGGLNALLLDAAEATGLVEIHFNQRCFDLDIEQGIAVFSDNDSNEEQQCHFDRVIGADGANSLVRKAILDKHCDRDEHQSLGHAYKELEIPASPSGEFQMEKEALHIWPRGGYMLIALPNLDGSFTCTLFLPSEGEHSFSSLKEREDVEAFFNENFADAMALMPNFIDMYLANPVGSLATIRCAPWYFEDKAMIIGDAAHAIVPFHGQGMNCGFEDCMVLANSLDTCVDWSTLLPVYQHLRLPNGNAIADMALDNYIEMRDSVRDAKYLRKKAIGFELEKRFPEAFVPRYSMVMFHHLPYKEAQRRGDINDEILEMLAQKGDENNIDWRLAEELVKTMLLSE